MNLELRNRIALKNALARRKVMKRGKAVPLRLKSIEELKAKELKDLGFKVRLGDDQIQHHPYGKTKSQNTTLKDVVTELQTNRGKLDEVVKQLQENKSKVEEVDSDDSLPSLSPLPPAGAGDVSDSDASVSDEDEPELLPITVFKKRYPSSTDWSLRWGLDLDRPASSYKKHVVTLSDGKKTVSYNTVLKDMGKKGAYFNTETNTVEIRSPPPSA